MKSRRIHVTGASGSGVTSLGRALAEPLALPQHDTHDYLWKPATPCPVLRLDGSRPLFELVLEVRRAVDG
jgi:hypothetical protein